MTTITIPDDLAAKVAELAAAQGESLEQLVEATLEELLEDLADDQAIIESRRDAEPTRSWEDYLASRGERVPTDSD